MINALTIDVEDWYQTRDFNFKIEDWKNYESRIEHSTKIILDLLSQYNTRATFFILGCIAKEYPMLVKSIIQNGHEIGSHGGWHRMVNTLTPEEFREDLLFSKQVLEDIAGTKVHLYRAPTWSITSDTLWALDILEEEGFTCDSSMQPFKTPISGLGKIPSSPFYPVVGTRKYKILEVPSTVLDLGKIRLPFSGGVYLRLLPAFFISNALKKVNTKNPGMVYIHTWELDTAQPQLKVPFHIRAAHYYNLRTTKDKTVFLLKKFQFVPLGELITKGTYPTYWLKKI